MRVLVTGYSGFIGRNFTRMSRDFNIKGVDLLSQNISDIDFSDIDTVLHLAAVVHQMNRTSDDLYFKINRDLAYNVADRAKKNSVKQFVFMSTVKVYGESTSEQGYFNENSICEPTDAYGKSKLEAEILIKSLEDENFKVAIIRSPLVYGTEVKANMFNLIKLVDKFRILPFGGIDNKRSMVYIGNLVALINTIIRKRASGIFIAGDLEPLATSQIIQFISEGFGKKIVLFKLPNIVIRIISKIIPAHVNRLYGSLVIDNVYTNNNLNFYPPFTSKEGIQEMIKWYNIQKKCN